MRLPPLNILTGLGLTFLGALVLLGWLIHAPALVRLFSNFDSIPSTTALGFVMAGLALVFTPPSATENISPNPKALLLAGTLILLGIAAMALWTNNIHLGLGISPAAMAQWLNDTNPFPDRMRPLAAMGFVSVGVVIALLNTSKNALELLLAQVLSLGITLIGVFGVVGQVFGMKDIFNWYIGTVFHAGVGFILCGIGLLALEAQDRRFQLYWEQSDSRKISFVGATIIIVTGLLGVFGSFAILYPQVETELQNDLQLSLKDRGSKFRSALESSWLTSHQFANQPLRLEAMVKLNRNAQDKAVRASLQRVADSYRSFGFSAVAFRNRDGLDVAHAGSFLSAPELAIPINTPAPSTLLWKNGFVLHSHIEMKHEGAVVGSLEADFPLPILGKELHDTAYIGETTDFAVCAPAGKDMHCFPFRSTAGKVLRNLPSDFKGKPIPMSYALAGKSGLIHTKDYRGREVIAAYAPVGTLGLGTVLKIDAAELYHPIAAKIEPLLALMFVLGAVGVVVLRLQVTPLAQKMAKEISERKIAEANLKESEEWFRLISTSANVGIVIIGPEERISYWNPAAERIFGYASSEAVGQQLHALLAPERFRDEFQRGFAHFRSSGQSAAGGRTIEVQALRKGGEEFPIELSISPLQVKGQWHALGIIQDITERKHMETALQKLNQTLAQQVQEEVAKNLEKERLLVQQSRLAAMGEMISNIAHQWRQPINALGLILANIQDAFEYGELDKDYLKHSVESGNRLIHNMSTTIDDFRNFFRPTSEKRCFRMCDGVNEAVQLVRDSFRNSDIEIIVEPCDQGFFVEGHPTEYSQVVLNALSNAKDAILARRVPGKIRITSETQGNTSVVSIQDNGGGIPAAVMGRIFDPYFTTKEGGTGIGLYMSKMIMKKMGGDITVRNLDDGAETLISMPVSPNPQ